MSWPPERPPAKTTGASSARAAYSAAVSPAGPEPMMMSRAMRVHFFAPPCLPLQGIPRSDHVASVPMVDGQTKTPIEFRLRVVWIALAYFAGFFLGGFFQDTMLHGGPEPTIVVLGSRFGQAGIEFFAWLAVAFVVAAWLVRWWGSSYHSPGVVMSGDVVTDEFTVAGPYR